MSIDDQLTKEIDEAVEEVTVISEDTTEEVLVPSIEEETETVIKKGEKPEEEDFSGESEEEESNSEKEEETPSGSSVLKANPESGSPPVSFSNKTLSDAIRHGLTFSEAKSFNSEAELSDFTARLARDRIADEREQEQVVDPFTDLPKLDPDNYDQEVIEMFDRLTGIVKGQYETINDFQQSQKNFQQQHQEAQNSANLIEVEGWFDKQVSELGDDFKEDLGDGSFSSLDRNGSQYQKRDEIATKMSILIAGHKTNNLPVPTREEIFNTATQMVLSERYGKIESNKLSTKLRNQSKQHIQRANKPSSSVAKTPEDEDKELADLLDEKFST